MTSINSINNIQSLESFQSLQKLSNTDDTKNVPFKSIFEEAVNNVIETQQAVDEESMLLATGQTDDVHNLTIAATKASLSVDLLVQLRNKTMDAYNEIMRMNI